MQARFLLGPAGTGKTFICLKEIRDALLAQPDGPPLVLLAPKQATFQLERQLLADEKLPGYTRLQILSFERLAHFILKKLGGPEHPLLSEEGRTMVLRALLARRKSSLKIFHSSAGLTGFARQLSLELRELQRHQISPAALEKLATRSDLSEPLRRKLHDLEILLRDYLDWLKAHDLRDNDCLLDLAAEALGENSAIRNPQSAIRNSLSSPLIATLWLDGFAEMTPQELGLLTAVGPWCGKMNLAFCLDQESKAIHDSWLSIWSGIGRTWRECSERMAAWPEAKLTLNVLQRDIQPGRFSKNPVLQHLEANWNEPKPFTLPEKDRSLQLALCANPEAEAVLAAREILQFVRDGGRFREAAVLLRTVEGYHGVLQRVFSRYDIPTFLDRRESVAHHPLAELTRSALRVVAFHWQQEDWFGALKSGLVSGQEQMIDELENEALKRGWKGESWFGPLLDKGQPIAWAEHLRDQCLPAFVALKKNLSLKSNGKQLADALEQFWRDLKVEETMEAWNASDSSNPQSAIRNPQFPQIHSTVWTQMNDWLRDVALAFATDAMSLKDWLPILEAGLSGLTVGVIPPALDQVTIGTVDRSRNPELKLALVLGLNEGIFPAVPTEKNLLSETERDELERCEVELGPDKLQFISRERYFGYIACTRARERLVLTCAQRNADDKPLNPSSFFSRLTRLFPGIKLEEYAVPDWTEAMHGSEIIGKIIAGQSGLENFAQMPRFADLRQQMKWLRRENTETLSPALADKLYGPVLSTSVSRLEEFAACNFRFFVHSGLQAEERKLFELDVRERGSFQHEVLAEFHDELKAEKKNWRAVTPGEARKRIEKIAAKLAPHFNEGLMNSSGHSRFTARTLSDSLQDFAATIVEWMEHYQFDPAAAELGFGMKENTLPGWEVDLGEGHRLNFRGVIDRIDLHRSADGKEALAVVMDYKSSERKLDKVMLTHGLQLQLPAYLSALRQLKNPREHFGVDRIIPAGVFYVNLHGKFAGGKTRREVLSALQEARYGAYQHLGRFDVEALPLLDARGESKGVQFKYRLKNDGQPYASSIDLMSAVAFKEFLDGVEAHLLRMGREIFAGQIAVNPYQIGKKRACDFCEYQGICRIDPWTHEFRILSADETEEE